VQDFRSAHCRPAPFSLVADFCLLKSQNDAVSRLERECDDTISLPELLGSAAAWPFAVSAQQSGALKRVGGVSSSVAGVGVDCRAQRLDRIPSAPRAIASTGSDARRNWLRSRRMRSGQAPSDCSLDYLVRDRDKCCGYFESERLRDFEVDEVLKISSVVLQGVHWVWRPSVSCLQRPPHGDTLQCCQVHRTSTRQHRKFLANKRIMPYDVQPPISR
jgi:hypothetical protein